MQSQQGQCPFCSIDPTRIVHSNEHGFAVRDGFPVSEGHSLIIPKRHVGSFFDLSTEEQHALLELLNETKETLTKFSICNPASIESPQPKDFNIGINDGPLAGQTVPHCHIHLIPRYEGDVADPRGGVRWVIAEKADYWSKRK